MRSYYDGHGCHTDRSDRMREQVAECLQTLYKNAFSAGFSLQELNDILETARARPVPLLTLNELGKARKLEYCLARLRRTATGLKRTKFCQG